MEEVLVEKAITKKAFTPEERLKRDLATLVSLHGVLNRLIHANPNSEPRVLLIDLEEVGRLFEMISWKEDDAICIRNRHGYRNRHKDKGNQVNTEGAKCDFESLAKLKELAMDTQANLLLLEDRDLLKASLNILKNKIDYLLAFYFDELDDEQKRLVQPIHAALQQKSQNEEVGLLRVLPAYYHDQQSLRRLQDLLADFVRKRYSQLDLDDNISRYQLGYFFTQFGEIAKEVSEYLKPETNTKSADLNFTRFLFSKLGKLRQIIKNKHWRVSGDNPTKLRNMLIRFECGCRQLDEILGKLILLTQSIPANAGSIVKFYSTINEAKTADGSKFEQENREAIDSLLIIFDTPDKNSQAQIDELNIQIKREEELIATHEAEILPVTQAGTAIKPLQPLIPGTDHVKKLFDAVLYIKPTRAPQVVALCDHVDEQLLRTHLRDEAKVNLCLALRAMSRTIQNPNPDKATVLTKIISRYIESVDRAIEKYNQSVEDTSFQVKIGDYSNLVDLYQAFCLTSNAEEKQAQSRADSHKAKSKAHQLQVAELRKRFERVTQFHEDFERVQNGSKKLSSVPRTSHRKLNKIDSILYDIIKNSEFMQFIMIQLKKISQDSTDAYQALVMAEKMCFGIIGQLYKLVSDESVDIFHQNLIDDSIFSADVFEAMIVRHKQVSHNVHLCDMTVVSRTAERKVLPWLQDYKHMLALSLQEKGVVIDEVTDITPLDSRLVESFESLDAYNRGVFQIYTRIVALNRFLQSQKALDVYDAMDELTEHVNPELATELHWQATLACRNLNDFVRCAEIHKTVISWAKRIPDPLLCNYKVYGAYCDFAIACIELDRYEEARGFLLEVTTKSSSSPQVIGANVLLGGLDLLEGHEVVGQARLELTFMKYFDQILAFSKMQAFSLLNHLASLYLDQFHLEHARDCLNLAEGILTDSFHEFIPTTGQQAVYFRLMIQQVLARYKILEALAEAGEQLEPKLRSIQLQLLETAEQEKSLTYLSAKKTLRPLVSTVLLGVESPEAIALVQPYLGEFTGDAENQDDIVLAVIEMKTEIHHFYYTHVVDNPLNEEEFRKVTSKHQEMLNALTLKVVAKYEQLALSAYIRQDVREANSLMTLAILYQGIVDYLEYEFEDIRRSIAEAEYDISLSMSYAEAWIHQPIDVEKLRTFLRRKLLGLIRQQGYVAPQSTIIQEYLDTKNDNDARDNKIDEYEVALMQAFYFEEGSINPFMRVDERRGLFISRYWIRDDDGAMKIQERKTAYTPSSVLNSGFSAETQNLFKGMFGERPTPLKQSKTAPTPTKIPVAEPRAKAPAPTAPSRPARPPSFSKETNSLFSGMFNRKPQTKTTPIVSPSKAPPLPRTPQQIPANPPLEPASPQNTDPTGDDVARLLRFLDESSELDNPPLDDTEADAAIEEYEQEQEQAKKR